MKLLLDAGLPYRAVRLLREAGHDATHVEDVGPAGLTDEAILAMARQEGRVVVTLDTDFHALLAATKATKPSVIRLRMQGLREHKASQVIQQIIHDCAEALEAGAAVSATATRVRSRRLPLP